MSTRESVPLRTEELNFNFPLKVSPWLNKQKLICTALCCIFQWSVSVYLKKKTKLARKSSHSPHGFTTTRQTHRLIDLKQSGTHPLTNGPLSQCYYDSLPTLLYLKLKLKQNSSYMRRAVTKQTIKQGKKFFPAQR